MLHGDRFAAARVSCRLAVRGLRQGDADSLRHFADDFRDLALRHVFHPSCIQLTLLPELPKELGIEVSSIQHWCL